MQVKKEVVKQRIMDCAKDEFLSKGYRDASLREIAKKAEVTKGNIYTYFKSKDDLFCAIVSPALQIFKQELSADYVNMSKEAVIKELYSVEQSLEGFRKHVDIIREHRDEMRLLFFSSESSSLSTYREEVARMYEESSSRFYEAMSKYDSRFSNNVTYLFLHSCAQLYLGFIEELLLHNPEGAELESYLSEMSAFVSSGMKAILQLKRKK